MSSLRKSIRRRGRSSDAAYSAEPSKDGKYVRLTVQTATGTTRVAIPIGSLDLPDGKNFESTKAS